MCCFSRTILDPKANEAHGNKEINDFFRSLYKSDLWLEKTYTQSMAAKLLQFIRVYVHLAWKSFEKFENKFALVPKVHALHEVQEEMVRQAAVSQWVLNPICETCSVDEDLIGRVAILTRRVSPKIIGKRALARYLAQINIVWAR